MEESNYIVNESKIKGFWVCTDLNSGIMVEWKECDFSYTKIILNKEDSEFHYTDNEESEILDGMANWLVVNHRSKL